MEVLEVARKMQAVMKRIGTLASELDNAGTEKAASEIEYEKAMAVAIVSLKAEGHPATLIDKLAKGRCSEVSFIAKVAEVKYKSLITKIHAAESILNGWQSCNRYLDKT